MSEALALSHDVEPDYTQSFSAVFKDHANEPATVGALMSLVDGLFDALKQARGDINTLQASISALGTRTADLEMAIGAPQSEAQKTLLARVKALETRAPRGADYCGAFVEGRHYSKHSMVTKSGNLFIAAVDRPGGVPGTDSGRDAWHMAAKMAEKRP